MRVNYYGQRLLQSLVGLTQKRRRFGLELSCFKKSLGLKKKPKKSYEIISVVGIVCCHSKMDSMCKIGACVPRCRWSLEVVQLHVSKYSRYSDNVELK